MSSKYGSIWKSAAAGAIGGLAASWVMNQFQSLLAKAEQELSTDQGGSQKSGGEDATVKTAQAISQHLLNYELTSDEKKWAGPAVHYTLGTLLGTIYGVLAETVPLSRGGYGAVYGSMVWLAADEIAVPALGLSKSPLETPGPSHVKALASHLVYGVTTDLARRAIVKLQMEFAETLRGHS